MEGIDEKIMQVMFSKLLEAFSSQLIILVFIYVLVLCMIFADLFSGVRKAKQRGEYRSSFGLRKTVDKIAKYFNVMLVVTIIDILQMLAIYHINPQISFNIPMVPVATFVIAIFFGIIEVKSIYEKAEDKDKGKYQDAAKLAGKIMGDPNAQTILATLFQYLKCENKKDDNASI